MYGHMYVCTFAFIYICKTKCLYTVLKCLLIFSSTLAHQAALKGLLGFLWF